MYSDCWLILSQMEDYSIFSARGKISIFVQKPGSAKNSNAAIIGITESKLDKPILDNEVKIDGYELKRADRNREDGDVVCYIRKDLPFNVRKKFSADLKSIFFDLLSLKSKQIHIIIIYGPFDLSSSLKKSMQPFQKQNMLILRSFRPEGLGYRYNKQQT